MKCERCKKARYCGRKCQKAAWKAGHKAQCQPAESLEAALPAPEADHPAGAANVGDNIQASLMPAPVRDQEKVCIRCKQPGSPLRCSGCKRVRYCSAGCQKADWKQHKKACKP